MANGTLGKSMTNSGNYVTVYTVPAQAQFATVQLECLNIDPANNATIKVAVTLTPATPGLTDLIEFDAVLPMNGGELERTSLILGPNEAICVEADNSNVVVRVSGLEQIV